MFVPVIISFFTIFVEMHSIDEVKNKNICWISGRRCEININECESNPCQYNGTCKDGINGYTCDCIPGITGPNCETDINECASAPCQNEGQCHDRING